MFRWEGAVKLADNITDDLAEHVRNVERQFIAASWLNPIAANNAGADAGLCGRSFAYNEHSAVFFYTCRCAELGTTPDIRQCVAAMHAIGEPLNSEDDVAETDLYWLIMEPSGNNTSAGDTAALADLAYRIVRQHTDREEFANASDNINAILDRVRKQCGNDRQSRETSRRTFRYQTFRRTHQPS